MKKSLLFSLGAILAGIFFTGCAGEKFQVYTSEIYDREYYTARNKAKKDIRVIGSFEDTKENEALINKSIENVLNSYKEIDTLQSKAERRSYTDNEIYRRCNNRLRGRYYGNYRNQYEKDKLVAICINDLEGRKVNIVTHTGEKVKVFTKNVHSIRFVRTYDSKKYDSVAFIRQKKEDDLIVVYIQNPPKSETFVDFIELNNKLIEEFKKNKLQSTNKKEVSLTF